MTIAVHMNDCTQPHMLYDLEPGQEATRERCKVAFLATRESVGSPQGLVDVVDSKGERIAQYDFCQH